MPAVALERTTAQATQAPLRGLEAAAVAAAGLLTRQVIPHQVALAAQQEQYQAAAQEPVAALEGLELQTAPEPAAAAAAVVEPLQAAATEALAERQEEVEEAELPPLTETPQEPAAMAVLAR